MKNKYKMNDIIKMAQDLNNGINYIDYYTPVIYKIPDDSYEASEIKKFLDLINANTKMMISNIYRDNLHAYNLNRIIILTYNKTKLKEILQNNIKIKCKI